MSELQRIEAEMKKAIDRLKSDFASLRTGRAHIHMLEGIKVEYFGSFLPVQQVASVSAPDAKTLEIKPWDKEALKNIEQAIIKSDLGMSPLNDGKCLRLSIPTLTTERKKDLVRVIRKQAEDFRIAIRNLRREGVEEIKKQEKDKKISQDDLKRGEQEIQKCTDQYIKNIEDLILAKEKDILES
ncbi:MAG: ribosome recycling factor [Elusimicrobia bacterium RIFCSPLOWO2_02_FULL_39_32]|nr:MAG: ribosome recycling factor [Elusimicrobia bacterium GWA2_38_7]OGR81305.1 MAG: ribosome recycling factor [Elusimicrobia bacterium RIFCSPHIGHO2_02_FULL_39_36]OGR91418.1 MAG: ribosome recycling factor [Elusimicrobia bacterium RIFCSPLOWO2_02_FULL_39_32]OGR98533.1 MAG: ribosome recycling factor [Elusimicrobia bacterium RIFCSPLOWO2_12_FULL_39_28]